MRFEVIELNNGRTGIYNNETGHTMISTDNLSKNDLDKGAEILNYLCNKFDENDKRYNGENILARLKTKIWIFLLFFITNLDCSYGCEQYMKSKHLYTMKANIVIDEVNRRELKWTLKI